MRLYVVCGVVGVVWLVDALIQSCFSAYCKHRYIPVYSTDFPRNNGHPVCKSDFSSAPRFYRECYQFFAPFYRIFHLFYKLSPFWGRYFTLPHPVFSALFCSFRHKTPAFLIAPPAFSTQQTEISFFTPFLHKPHISLLINNIRNLTNP